MSLKTLLSVYIYEYCFLFHILTIVILINVLNVDDDGNEINKIRECQKRYKDIRHEHWRERRKQRDNLCKTEIQRGIVREN